MPTFASLAALLEQISGYPDPVLVVDGYPVYWRKLNPAYAELWKDALLRWHQLDDLPAKKLSGRHAHRWRNLGDKLEDGPTLKRVGEGCAIEPTFSSAEVEFLLALDSVVADGTAGYKANDLTDGDAYFPAKHYAKFNIAADTLRKAAQDNRIQHRKGNGNRNHYCDRDVRQRWPHLFTD